MRKAGIVFCKMAVELLEHWQRVAEGRDSLRGRKDGMFGWSGICTPDLLCVSSAAFL